MHRRIVPLLAVPAVALAALGISAPVEAAAGPGVPPPRISPRPPLTGENFYFVMTDRFRNADRSNDRAGLSGPREVTGFDPTKKGWYHGGDLAGLIRELDYIQGLGTTTIWLTPSFKNKYVQGTFPYESAGYHGYWVTDFTQIDPHLGTNDELKALIDASHARGMKVFFDIITNHTADVINYREGEYDYIPKEDVPYRTAGGRVFDDRDYAGTGRFPALSPTVSFPSTPFAPEGEEDVKVPAWLNDVTLYHNRGNTTFEGENSLYGDFFGLDDLFTEHPKVVRGMEQIYDTWIRDAGVDGFRIDTMKHVNMEFWQQFLPHIRETAVAAGTPEFFAFGEVAEESDAPFLSEFTTTGQAQSVLDFRFMAQGRAFAGQDAPTQAIAAMFDQDDWFTDADSNAYQMPTFLGNHDNGRIGMFLRELTGGASEAELLARDRLAHALLYFSRGNPVVYYGDEQGFTGVGGDQTARQDMGVSRDREYDNLSNDPPADDGSSTDDGGKNDNIGSVVTPMVDNFDTSHPMYLTIAKLAAVTKAHPALRDGAQQMRYSSAAAGILAFSRTDAREQVEHVVLLNNAPGSAGAAVPTATPSTSFVKIYGSGPGRLRSSATGALSVRLPGLSSAVYMAEKPVPASAAAPAVSVEVTDSGSDRPQVQAVVAGTSPYQVTFYAAADGATSWTPLGTDDNAPYRVYPQLDQWEPGTPLRITAVLRDNAGHVSRGVASLTVGEAG